MYELILGLDAIEQSRELCEFITLEKLHFVPRLCTRKVCTCPNQISVLPSELGVGAASSSACVCGGSARAQTSMVRVSTPRSLPGQQLRSAPDIETAAPPADSNSINTAAIQVVATTCATEPARMSRAAFFAFAVGHVLNDMQASCWFSYLLCVS